MRLLPPFRSCAGRPSSSSIPGSPVWFLCFLTALIGLPVLAAGDVVIIVSDDAPQVQISDAELLATLPETAGPVLQTTPAGRGFLFDLAGSSDTYQPFAEFFHHGSDSYHFEADLKDTSVWGTAFLVAGMSDVAHFLYGVDGNSLNR